MKNKELIKKMTLEDKVSLLSGKDFWQTQDIKKLDIPSMFLADGPHGIRKQAAAADHLGLNESIKATCFPTSATLANTWNTELIENLGKHLGLEALDQKVNVLLGPGTNIKRSPLCGRNFEYFSEDPYLSGKIASAHIRGVQSNGISACIKHFAANNQEERRLVIDTIVDERTLREIYLTPFEMAVKEGEVKTVMSAYNKINGIYANENQFLLNDVLRKEWGFEGIVVTDWGGNNDRIDALNATNELEMPGNAGETNREVLKAVKEGLVSEKTLDEAVDRLLTITLETNKAIEDNKTIVNYDNHHEIAYEAAKEAIVLLENKNNVLPLVKTSKVAIIGDFAETPRYQGAGSSIVNPTKIDNTLSFIREYNSSFVGFEKGFKRYGKKSKSLIKKAVKLANQADTILLYLGLDEISEAEGIDRENIKLPENQIQLLEELVKTGKKIIVILSAGSVVEINFAEKVDAIVHGYLLGQAGAKAILDVVFGKVNPSGRLSETIPYSYDDVSSAPYFPGKEVSVEYREGLFVGYRYFDKVGKDVRYPFGYGLSYTDFEYSNIKVDNKGVNFKVKNIGKVAGSDVAQLYVGLEKSKIFRAKKELKGFTKVFLKPNESKEVFIPFDLYTFRYFNKTTNKYEIEEGTYKISINRSIIDNVLSDNLEVKGTTNKNPYEGLDLSSYESGNIKEVDTIEFESLLGSKVPNPNRNYYKKNRIVVDYNTTVMELRYAKGWTGRIFARVMRFAPKLMKFFGKKELANTIIMGMHHQPMRGLSRMTNGMVSWGQLDGLILMFNGKFFKGVNKYFKEGKIKKKLHKEERKRQEMESKSEDQEQEQVKEKGIMGAWKRFTVKRPVISQFLIFFIISNGVTLLQLLLMPAFKAMFNQTELLNIGFQFGRIGKNLDGTAYYMFNYPAGAMINGLGGGMAYFLSVQITLAIAQIINFFLQRSVTFKSNSNAWIAAMWYFLAYVAITFIAAALQGLYKAPIYNLLMNTWNMGSTGELFADFITMIINSAISFWVFFPIFKIIFKQEKEEVLD